MGNILQDQLSNLETKGLLHTFNLSDTCLDIGGLKLGDNGLQTLPVPATYMSGSSAASAIEATSVTSCTGSAITAAPSLSSSGEGAMTERAPVVHLTGGESTTIVTAIQGLTSKLTLLLLNETCDWKGSQYGVFGR